MAAVALLVVGFGGGSAVAAGDPCDPLFKKSTVERLKAYTACREDRQDASLKRIEAKLDALAKQNDAASTPTARPSATSSPGPAAPSSTTTAPVTPTPSVRFANPSTTGVQPGWTPATTRTTDLRVTTAGAVVEDLRLVGADLIIDAPDVTVRRVEIQGGKINNYAGSSCHNGLTLEDVSLLRAPGQKTDSTGDGAVSAGGYTARHVKIDGLPEGFRLGGAPSCGPVSIEHSFVRIRYPDICDDWHGDGLQGYGGSALTVRDLTIDFIESDGCNGTAPFFVPAGQGNTSVDVDGLLVRGGGFSFRSGVPGKLTNIKIVDRAFGYGPLDVKCSVVKAWSAELVTIDDSYSPTTLRSLPCSTEGGR